jgi:hypothetical protein
LVNADKATKARIADLKAAEDRAKAASAKLAADAIATAKLLAATESEIAKKRAEHDARLEREAKEHAARLAKVDADFKAKVEAVQDQLAVERATLKQKADILRQGIGAVS